MIKQGLTILSMGILITAFSGCEYDAPTSMWNQAYEASESPVILQMEPETAVAGVNFLKLQGENFSPVAGNNNVFFNNVAGEIVAESPTEITVRRPNLSGDSVTVKISCNDGYVVGEYGPYQIDPVMQVYDPDPLSDDVALTACAVDADEHVYVFQKIPNAVYRLNSPAEQATKIGDTKKVVTDAKAGPGGWLYYLGKDKKVFRMNPADGVEEEWTSVSKRVEFMDYTPEGVMYVGGSKTDVLGVAADGTQLAVSDGIYINFEIECLRVYNGYLYVLALDKKNVEGNPLMAVWRNEILDAQGALGAKELVLDWAETGDFAESTPYSVEFSASGVMYVGCDHNDPVLIVNPDGSHDIFYKSILIKNAVDLVWSNQNNLYQVQHELVIGDGGNVLTSKMYQIPMSEAGASYSGRSM